jgi:predicted component of type VI protein secretion system
MPRVTITVPGKSPQPYRFQLDCTLVSLGRGSRNDIVIDCGSVSVTHAEMRRVEGGFVLADLASTNGIKLDGERRELVPLHDGISLSLGDVLFEFQLSEEEREELGHEAPANELPPLPEALPEALPESEPEQDAQPVRRPKHKPKPKALHSEAPPEAGAIFWLFILALAAFCVGMAIRYERDTGESWLKAVISRGQAATSGSESGK